MNWQVIKIHGLRWLRRIVLYGGYLFVVVTLLGFLILQLPATQETLLQRYVTQLNKVSGFQISSESMYLLWYDHLQIKGLHVRDPENNTMIKVDELRINFRITSLWSKNNINIDGASINVAEVNLIKIQETDSTRDLNINVFINRLNGNTSGGGNPPKINLGEVSVNRSSFSYDDNDRDSIKQGFDYYHFQLAIPNGELRNFQVIGDTIQFRVNDLQATDRKTALAVQSMNTFFRISQSSLEFLDLHMNAGKSHLSDTITFAFKRQGDLNDFNNKVTLRANLRESVLHPADLALFAPGAERLQHPLTISGKFTGKISRLFGRNVELSYGNTRLNGKVNLDGLPSLNETFMALDLQKSQVSIHDFQPFFTPEVYRRLRPLRRFDLAGTFTGFVNDFVANGILEGSIGTIRSDINLKVDTENIDQSTYRGNLVLSNFDLGTFLNDTVNFQKVNIRGDINGRGLSYSSANFLLNGNISSIGIYGYNYQNIQTNARLASQFFNGRLVVNDPNLKFSAEGSIDFRKEKKLVNVKAQLDSAKLLPLGLSKEHVFLRSYVDIDSRGLKLDSLFGDALFKNTRVEYKKNVLEVDSIHLFSEKIDNERQIRIRSSMFDMGLRGNYYYSTLFNDINLLAHELLISIRNDQAALNAYYKNKKRSGQSYDAQFTFELHDINPLIELSGLDLQVSKGTLLNGRFSNGLTTIVHAYSHVDSLTYAGKLFEQNDFELTGSKIRDSANVLAMVTVQSAMQTLGKQMKTKNLNIEGLWNRDHVDLSLGLDQAGADNSIRLRSEIDFLRDSVKIKLLPSRIQALEKIWEINQRNYIL
ncbi:MAG: hypothetical protein ACOYW3_11075, partial [Bacteroidota bacterium]